MGVTYCNQPSRYLTELRELLTVIDPAAIDLATARLWEVWQQDRLIITLGNGGSACTASHFVTDLVKTATVEGCRPFRSISLTDNTGLLTAVSNDLDYGQSFVYPLAAYARAGDAVIAISASGNSPNVVAACQWAQEHGVSVIALTGFSGGKTVELADISIHIPSNNYGLVEDLHLAVGHMISQALRAHMQRQGASA